MFRVRRESRLRGAGLEIEEVKGLEFQCFGVLEARPHSITRSSCLNTCSGGWSRA